MHVASSRKVRLVTCGFDFLPAEKQLAKTGAEIVALFRELQAEGVTLIMVTHDPEVAGQGKRIVQILDGKILMDVPVEEWRP